MENKHIQRGKNSFERSSGLALANTQGASLPRAFAFDLQLFGSEVPTALQLVSIKNGKAVLTALQKTYIEQEDGDGYYAIILNGETISLNYLADNETINITDGTGNVYGTIDKSGKITLTEPAEGLPRITEVASISSDYCKIYNGQYLGEGTVCKVSVPDGYNGSGLDIFKEGHGAYVRIAPTSTQGAEAVYHSDGGLSSAKNADIFIRKCYALLPNGTRVENKSGGACYLIADSQGNMSVTNGTFSADGIVSLEVSSIVGVGLNLRDSSGISRSVTPYPGRVASYMNLDTEEDFKGTYDGKTGTLSLAQGALRVDVNPIIYYYYVVHAADKTIAIYKGANLNTQPSLQASFAYTDLANVSFSLATNLTLDNSLLAEADYGLTLDTEVKTITGNTLTLTASETRNAMAYLSADKKRYATLAKTKNGYALTAEESASSFTEVDFTGLDKKKVQVDAANLASAVQYTTKGGAFTTTDKSFSVTQNDTLTTLEGADNAKLLKAGKYNFTTATAVTIGKAGTYTLGGKAYTANTATKFSVSGSTVKLTAGTVTLANKGTITIGTTTYTAAANNTAIAYVSTNQGKLTSGSVTLAQGKSIATAAGILTAKTGGFNVTSAGVVSGIGAGEKFTFTTTINKKTYTYNYVVDTRNKAVSVTGSAKATIKYLDLTKVSFNMKSFKASGYYGLSGLFDALPKNASYANNQKNVNLTKAFSGTIDLSRYAPTLQTVDGSKTTKGITLKGTAKNNTLKGGSGKDKLYGTAGTNTLYGYAGNDSLTGGTGTDYLYAGAGNDTLKGGKGNDKLYAQSGNNTLWGEAGNDYLEGGTGTDILRGGLGNDTIKGGKGVDKFQFYKGDGKDTIQNAAKNDILYLYNISNIKKQAKFKMSGKNLVMSFTTNKNDTITLTNWTTSGMNKFVVGGKTYSLKKSGNIVAVK